MYKEKIIQEMKAVFKEIHYGIEHTFKVLKNAEDIMEGEHIKEEMRELITVVAILHDIGAVEALRKYGSTEGPYQEIEGPAVARDILEKIGYPSKYIDRICYIIGNHHTPCKINGLDFQILWEADLLENLIGTQGKEDKYKLKDIIDKNYKTTTGRRIAYEVLNCIN